MVSASLIPTCLQTGANLGVSSEIMEAYVDRLGVEDFENSNIEYLHVFNLIEIIQRETKRKDIGFLLGEAFGFSYTPSVATFLRTLGSLRELTNNIDLVRRFFSPDFEIRFREEQGKAILDMPIGGTEYESIDREVLVLASEGILAFINKLLFELLGDQMKIESYFFNHPEPGNIDDYNHYFNTRLLFNQPSAGLVIPAAILDISLKGALPVLNTKARERMQKALDQDESSQSVTNSILNAFKKDNRLLHGSVVMTAMHFNVSERTLQRKLKKEGVTFFELQENAKKNVAAELIANGYALELISERLGFSDRRSFSRAFKRWFGCTPKDYRNKESYKIS